MPGSRYLQYLWVLVVTTGGIEPAQAWETVFIEPVIDNTLYETAIDQGEQKFELSNGAGNFLFSGRTGIDAGFRRRRALLKFDLQSALPADAIILAAELTLYQSKAAPGSPPAVMGMHRVLQEWGEAGSKGIGAEGQGNFAETGDATWHHRFYADELWDTAGGYFEATASALTTVGQQLDDYTWQCAASLLDDVQFWQQNPAANYGWIIVGGEDAGYSAHRFNSRENAVSEQRPRLAVLYDRESTVFANGFETPPVCP